MASLVGLLEQQELAARRRVDELREEADRVQAELAPAELEWQEWTIARKRVGAVLAPDEGRAVETEASVEPRCAGVRSTFRDAAKPRSQVLVWCGVKGCPGRRCRWTTSAF